MGGGGGRRRESGRGWERGAAKRERVGEWKEMENEGEKGTKVIDD